RRRRRNRRGSLRPRGSRTGRCASRCRLRRSALSWLVSGDGEEQLETRAALAVHEGELAAGRTRELAGDRQPDAGAARAGQRLVRAMERLEDLVALARRYAGPAIRDGDDV